MRKNILLIVFVFIGCILNAQTGIGTKSPHVSSALDISLANKGVLLSRVALKGTTDVSTIPLAANSLTVYNTATTNDVIPGYYYWSAIASRWIRLLDEVSSITTWRLKGNDASDYNNFIGTTNDNDLVFKRNNVVSGRLAVTNTSFGRNSLQNNTTGTSNVAFGNGALENNTIGINNAAFGSGALEKNSTGGNNTAMGTLALYNSVNGSHNVAMGLGASCRLEKGSFNVALGSDALYFNKSGNYNIAIGKMAGYDLLMYDNPDAFNIIIGSNAAKGLIRGIKNTVLGSNIDLPADLSNAIVIGEGAKTSVNNSIRLGNTSISSFTGQVAYSFTSDIRYKTNIESMPLGLDFINKLRPVQYIRKNNESKTKEWGVIAQELQQTLQAVDYKDAGLVQEDGSADKMLSVRYTDLIAPMIKAMQELSAENKELKIKNNQIEKKIEALERKVKNKRM